MDFFSDDARSVVLPQEMVKAFACRKEITSGDLLLEGLALVTFSALDLRRFTEGDKKVKKIAAWRNRRNRIYRGDGWIAVQSPFGASSAVMLLEELVAFGIKRAVYIGYCGSLQEKVGIGDIILPSEAIREEGTSYHYLRKGKRSVPDPIIQRQLFDWMMKVDKPVHTGKIWTTDAPYRETYKKVEHYRMEGILGVEMEMAAAFALGMVREISIGAVLLVSDRLKETGWDMGFFSSELRTTREKVIENLLLHLKEMVPTSSYSTMR